MFLYQGMNIILLSPLDMKPTHQINEQEGNEDPALKMDLFS